MTMAIAITNNSDYQTNQHYLPISAGVGRVGAQLVRAPAEKQ